jgi:transketolase
LATTEPDTQPRAEPTEAQAAQARILARPASEARRMADAIRVLAIDAVEAAKSGHPGMPMGMADVATVLFTRFLKYDAADPRWPDRDRFVLSAGHGSMLLYALLHLSGHAGMGIEELRRFRQLHSPAAGHPEFGEHPGIETTTGPLGQGVATAVGMALAERILAARFGKSLVDHRTWVICSDGDLQEGISHEACSLAGHLRLERLCLLWDDNSISIDGDTSLSFTDDTLKRFSAYGWAVRRVDGHDHEAVAAAIGWATRNRKPTLIACRTIIGFAAPRKAGTAASHGAPLGGEEAGAAKAALGWNHPPFEIPDGLKERWEAAGRRAPAPAGPGSSASPSTRRRRSSSAPWPASCPIPGTRGLRNCARTTPRHGRRWPPASRASARWKRWCPRCRRWSAARPISPARTIRTSRACQRSRPGCMSAATSTGACANTAWPPR